MAGADLQPRSGRIRNALRLVVVTAAAVAILVSGAPWAIDLGLAAAAVAAAFVSGRSGRAWRALRPAGPGTIEITDADGTRHRCACREAPFSSPWFVSFRAAAPAGPAFRVALFADELDSDDFRRLLAWLRHGVE